MRTHSKTNPCLAKNCRPQHNHQSIRNAQNVSLEFLLAAACTVVSSSVLLDQVQPCFVFCLLHFKTTRALDVGTNKVIGYCQFDQPMGTDFSTFKYGDSTIYSFQNTKSRSCPFRLIVQTIPITKNLNHGHCLWFKLNMSNYSTHSCVCWIL